MVSVIIPYRNAGKWLGRCEKSLQQDGDFEILFIDDNSTDGAKPDGFITLENEFTPGVSGARNTGLKYAKGDWITFLDADDELLPNAYAKFSKMLSADAGIHQSNHLRYYVNRGGGMRRYDNPEGEYTAPHVPQVWFGVWNKLYSRDLVKHVRFKEGMQYGEDEIFNLECLDLDNRIHCISDTIVKHNIDNMQSLSHIRTGKDLARELIELEKFLANAIDKDVKELAYETLVTRITTKWYKKAICDE